jgi:hypothetical protein
LKSFVAIVILRLRRFICIAERWRWRDPACERCTCAPLFRRRNLALGCILKSYSNLAVASLTSAPFGRTCFSFPLK